MLALTAAFAPSLVLNRAASTRRCDVRMQLTPGSTKLLVIGGNGYVGREVCKNAVQMGYKVTSLSRRGECPDPKDSDLAQVEWRAGNALDKPTVNSMVGEADAVVHAIGLLFDVDSGLTWANRFTSFSQSTPDPTESTYDRITRETAFNVIDAIQNNVLRPGPPLQKPVPLAFVSCAEAGWPDVPLGDRVEAVSPEWLLRYLVAKRAVEAKLTSSSKLRAIMYRPSLIWSWGKLDVLPVIPVFNIANALGVPFVDKTVRVEALGKAIVAGLADESVVGVQRFPEMERLAEELALPA